MAHMGHSKLYGFKVLYVKKEGEWVRSKLYGFKFFIDQREGEWVTFVWFVLLGEEVVEESTKRRRESRIQQQQKQQKSRETVDRPGRPSAEAAARSIGPVDRCAR